MSSVPRPRSATIQAVRRFNRFYTRKIGALDEGLLDSPFSLSEVRVLYELAHRRSPIASDILTALQLDPGYLSRILARFSRLKLIRREQSDEDGRARRLSLTARGLKSFAALNARSSREVASWIRHLPADAHRELVEHFRAIQHLFGEPVERAGPVLLRAPLPGDFGWVIQRHGAIYAAEYGWDSRFEALVARIVADYVDHHDAARERCWIAEHDGQRVGCIFLVRKTNSVAKLRLLLVEPTARGHGVGGKLVATCVAFAGRAGYRKIQLWTNSVLDAARHLYERAGFRLIHAEKHASFGHRLTGETWELRLSDAVAAPTISPAHSKATNNPLRGL